jgi:hypothetical protein
MEPAAPRATRSRLACPASPGRSAGPAWTAWPGEPSSPPVWRRAGPPAASSGRAMYSCTWPFQPLKGASSARVSLHVPCLLIPDAKVSKDTWWPCKSRALRVPVRVTALVHSSVFSCVAVRPLIHSANTARWCSTRMNVTRNQWFGMPLNPHPRLPSSWPGPARPGPRSVQPEAQAAAMSLSRARGPLAAQHRIEPARPARARHHPLPPGPVPGT